MCGSAAACAAAYDAHRHGHAAKRCEPDHSRILGRVVSKQGLARLGREVINRGFDIGICQCRVAAFGRHDPLAVQGRGMKGVDALRQTRAPGCCITGYGRPGHPLVVAEGARLAINFLAVGEIGFFACGGDGSGHGYGCLRCCADGCGPGWYGLNRRCLNRRHRGIRLDNGGNRFGRVHGCLLSLLRQFRLRHGNRGGSFSLSCYRQAGKSSSAWPEKPYFSL